jgi:hypothetical protein
LLNGKTVQFGLACLAILIMLEIQARLFGAFRDFTDLPTLSITCAPRTGIAELRQKMQQNLMPSKSGSYAAELLKQSIQALTSLACDHPER